MTCAGIIKIFPFENGARSEFLGEFVVHDDSVKNENFQTIIILDRSGSMGDMVERMITKIFPQFFAKLSYRKTNEIHLITFETFTEFIAASVGAFPDLSLSSGGWTHMEPAIHKCKEILKNLDSERPVRILTISDGDIQDKSESKVAADSLKVFLEDKSFLINSKAVRLFTTFSQPDTSAVCNFLLINNAFPNSLIDISGTESDDHIATKMSELFAGDNFDKTKSLTADGKTLRRQPWSKSTSKLLFSIGVNIVWIPELPNDAFRLNGIPLIIEMQKSITAEQHNVLMNCHSDSVIETMKVLKVVGSSESYRTLRKINQYFNNKISRSSTLTVKLNEIYSDESVRSMSSSEKALYILNKL